MSSHIAGKHVLVVEDEFFIAEEMRHDLEIQGAIVAGPASNMEEVRELLESAPRLDAAVLDINLHEEMTYSFADKLAARGVPFVFVTGYHRGSIPDQYAHVKLCEKPVEAEKVIAALFS